MQADKMEKTGKDNGKDHSKHHGKDHSKRQKTIHAAIKAPRHDEDEQPTSIIFLLSRWNREGNLMKESSVKLWCERSYQDKNQAMNSSVSDNHCRNDIRRV